MDGRRDETSELCHGQIASLAVLRTHRNLGYATQLMRAAGITSVNMLLDEFKRIFLLFDELEDYQRAWLEKREEIMEGMDEPTDTIILMCLNEQKRFTLLNVELLY